MLYLKCKPRVWQAECIFTCTAHGMRMDCMEASSGHTPVVQLFGGQVNSEGASQKLVLQAHYACFVACGHAGCNALADKLDTCQ